MEARKQSQCASRGRAMDSAGRLKTYSGAREQRYAYIVITVLISQCNIITVEIISDFSKRFSYSHGTINPILRGCAPRALTNSHADCSTRERSPEKENEGKAFQNP